MPNPASDILIGLECGHQNVYKRGQLPKVKEFAYCFKCARSRLVLSHLGSYTATCDHCRYRRWFGAARLRAWRMADAHAREYRGHRVTVALGDSILGYSGMTDQLTFDDVLDEEQCPF